MMKKKQQVMIYHNPRCSKSRATLELLRQRGIEPTIVEYLKTPPDPQALRQILRLLNMTPRELMRKQEPPYTANRLDNPKLSQQELLLAMIKDPILIERPVVLANDKAALGRPPENVLGIL